MRRPTTKLALPVTAPDLADRTRVSGQKRSVGEEMRDPVGGERLFEAGFVRTFRQPDARGIEAGEAARRATTDAKLRLHRWGIEQGEITVGRGGGEDLDVAALR